MLIYIVIYMPWHSCVFVKIDISLYRWYFRLLCHLTLISIDLLRVTTECLVIQIWMNSKKCLKWRYVLTFKCFIWCLSQQFLLIVGKLAVTINEHQEFILKHNICQTNCVYFVTGFTQEWTEQHFRDLSCQNACVSSNGINTQWRNTWQQPPNSNLWTRI